MALSTNILELCSGYGGLGLGLGLADRTARTVCHVEREVTAAGILAARMEDGSLHPAPIWSDLKTFDGRAWRGVVDIVTAGYPCQPFSVAGKRRGEDDPRHLWPEVARIVREVEPEWVFLENVGGHLRLGFREVAGELRTMGYRVAAGLFTAEEIGAPHRRERLFALAHSERYGLGSRRAECEGFERGSSSDNASGALEDAARLTGERGRGRGRVSQASDALADAERAERRPLAVAGSDRGEGRDRSGKAASELRERGGDLAYAAGARLRGRENAGANRSDEGENRSRSAEFERSRGTMAHAGRADYGRNPHALEVDRERSSGRVSGTSGKLADAGSERSQIGHKREYRDAERAAAARGGLLFPPGPGDLDAWRRVLAEWPEIEPAICRIPHGLTPRVDRLRALGNGVVPGVAAHAWRTLRAHFDGVIAGENADAAAAA